MTHPFGFDYVTFPLHHYQDAKAAVEALTVTEGALAYATDTNEVGYYDGSTWVWRGAMLADENVLHDKIGTPTLFTLHDDWITRGSSGVIDGTLTYVGVGSSAVKVSVAAGDGYIRTTNDQQGELKFCHWDAAADLYTFSAPAAGQETVVFIGIEYSAGTVAAVVKTAFSDWNWFSNFPLGRVSYDGTTMRILNAYAHSEDTANFTRKYLRLTHPFLREEAPEGSGGLEISSSLRALALSAGNVWHGFNRYIIGALASGAAFDTHYKRSGGGFNSTIGVTSWPNTQYDNGSGTLQDLTAAHYGTLWVYVDVSDGELDIVYGAVNAVSVSTAQADTTPTTPEHLRYHGRLIARIIFQKSAASAILVESAWTREFSSSVVGDHNLLSNLQGGTAGEYYHLVAPTAPAAGLLSVVGIANGETAYSLKALLDTTNPATLTVSAAAAPGTQLLAARRDHVHPITSSSAPGAAASLLATNSDGGLALDTTTLVVDGANGRVGMGTSAPAMPIVLSYSEATATAITNTVPGVIVTNYDTTVSNWSAIGFGQTQNGDTEAYVASQNISRTGGARSTDLVFGTNNSSTLSEKMRIHAAGQVGIGAAGGAGTKLHLTGSEPLLRQTYPSVRSWDMSVTSGGAWELRDASASSTRISIVGGTGAGGGDVTMTGILQTAGYKSSDGSTGLTGTVTVRNAAGTGTTVLTFKNGLFTAVI